MERRVIRRGMSILDLGPQDIVHYVGDAAENAILPPHSEPGDWYRSLGLGEYRSVDISDSRATHYMDLNKPVEAIDLVEVHKSFPKFDLIHNGGTLEHVFNIGQAFATIHNLLKPNGVALHSLPAAGEIDHGFYNIHPQLYYDLAAANKYVIESFMYVPDLDGTCLSMIGAPIFHPRPTKDYCFVALRKTSDDSFCMPIQRSPSRSIKERGADLVRPSKTFWSRLFR